MWLWIIELGEFLVHIIVIEVVFGRNEAFVSEIWQKINVRKSIVVEYCENVEHFAENPLPLGMRNKYMILYCFLFSYSFVNAFHDPSASVYVPLSDDLCSLLVRSCATRNLNEATVMMQHKKK